MHRGIFFREDSHGYRQCDENESLSGKPDSAGLHADTESAALFFIQRLAVLGFAKFEIDKGELDTEQAVQSEHGTEDKSSEKAEILE